MKYYSCRLEMSKTKGTAHNCWPLITTNSTVCMMSNQKLMKIGPLPEVTLSETEYSFKNNNLNDYLQQSIYIL